jgi:hypothetical protein
MKLQLKALSIALGAATLMAGSAWGESTAGVGIPTSTVSATAKVNINITVPKVILLKIGTAGGTVDTVDFTASLSSPTVAGTGNSLATTWTGTAPTFSVAATGDVLTAVAWTNSASGASGGTLSCSMTTAFASGGPTAADISVGSSVALAGGSLVHPGTNTNCATPTPFARNVLVGSTYTYSIAPGSVAAWAAGSYTSVVTYTATTL